MFSTFARFSILLILIGNYLWSEHLEVQDLSVQGQKAIYEQVALHQR